jgi:CRISPR/Cas system CMR subunit Cmr6 (Cas7 group RAMP superfamily)
MAAKKKTKPKKKPIKKTTSKPKKQTKTPAKKIAFDNAWKEYTASLNLWKESLAQWQKATNDTLRTYHDACQRAIESDAELLKKVSLSWEQTWVEMGPEYIKQQNKLIENIFKETNIDTIKKFNFQWEKFLTTSGDDSIKAYQEAIKQFNETWKSSQA